MDSDIEVGDSRLFTEMRILNKEKRWCSRKEGSIELPLSAKPGNKDVIDDFMKLKDSDNIASGTESKSLSTLRKHRGHLLNIRILGWRTALDLTRSIY